MKLKILFTALAATLCCMSATAAKPDSVDVFFYNHGSDKDGLKIAYSVDHRTWMKLCNDYSYVKSDYGSWGGDKAMRSTPSLAYRGGRWYAVWQVDNKLNQFATTFSDDLFLWKPQDYPYAQGVATVYNPLLCSSAKGFTVVFTTKDGKYYSTSSRDFVKWDSPKAITKADYDKCNRQTEITVAGVKLKGEKHRMAYKDIEMLRVLTADQKARGALTGERAAQDSHRFRGMSGLKAVLNVRPDDKKPISDKLMGIFFEDINYAADGGLYAEMVQNRDFEYSAHDNGKWNAMTCWTVTGSGLKAEIATESPIHENNPHYVRLETTAKGGALQNSGYDGIAVKKGAKFDLFLFGKNISGQNTLKVRLVQGGETVAETTIKLKSDNWQQCKAVLTAVKTADNCVLSIEPQQPGTAALDFISLFPQATFKNRKNGVRADLAQALADMKPRFVRFPGGCLSHGNGLDNMYRWKETIGDLWARKPQKNIWSYHQTKGLGFYEYFQFCEDLGAEPLPVLPAGVPCQNTSCEKGKGQMGGLPMDEMEAYTQELLDLIEWANADAKTSPLAAMRAKAGHPKPFNLKMIGIGNEDIIGDVFTERFNFINKRIKAKYPDIQVVGTVGPFNEGADYEFGWQLAKRENIDIVDEHYYVQPGWYIHNQNFYDKYDRNGTKVYLGEWASWGSELENALAEAIHLTNVERNADVVVMASYAPLFARKGHTQWNPDMIYFDNTTVEPTINYHVQKLFGQYSGDEYLYADMLLTSKDEKEGNASQIADAQKRVTYSVLRDTRTGAVIVKLVNMTNLPVDAEVNLGAPKLPSPAPRAATITRIAGKPSDKKADPVETTAQLADTFTQQLPPYSLTVIKIQ